MKKLLFLLGFMPVLSYAQGVFIPPRVVTGTVNGITRPIAGATITVCAFNTAGIPCSPALANTVFKDSGLTVPLSNPFTTDANGNYPQAAMAGGIYTITESAPGFAGFSYQASVSCAPGAGCTVTTFAASSATITGVLTAANIDGIVHVGGNVSSADIGTQINSAYAAFPSSGGKCIVDPNPAGGCYNFSTPVVGATVGKLLMVEGGAGGIAGVSTPSGPVCLNYIPTTATTAFTFDYATTGNQNATYVAMRNVFLVNNGCLTTGGCGSSATGVSSGTTNLGFSGGALENVSIHGFGTGFSDMNPNAPASNFVLQNLNLVSNTQAMKENNHSSVMFNGGTIAGNGAGILFPNSTSNGEIAMSMTTFFGQSGLDIDATAITGAPAQLYASGVHMERSVPFSAHSISGFIDIGWSNGLFEDDNSTGTTDWMITSSGNKVVIIGPSITTGRTATTFLVANSPARGLLQVYDPSAHFASGAYVTGANASHFTLMPLAAPANAAQPWKFESPLLGQDGSASVPSFGFIAHANTGLFEDGSGDPCITNGGTGNACFGAGTAGTIVATGGCYSWTATASPAGANDTSICRGAAGKVTVGTSNGGTQGVVQSAALLSGGAAAGLAGTGACATITTQSGGSYAGTAKCTGTTGASTLTITPGTTAPNGWVCYVQDETTRANLFQQTGHAATTCTLTVTSVTQNDVFVFTAIAF